MTSERASGPPAPGWGAAASQRGLGRLLARRPSETPSLRAASGDASRRRSSAKRRSFARPRHDKRPKPLREAAAAAMPGAWWTGSVRRHGIYSHNLLPSSNSHRASNAATALSHELSDNEERHIAGGDAANVGKAAGDRDRRVGEAGRGGEPVSGGDVEPDGGRHRLGARAEPPEDG